MLEAVLYLLRLTKQTIFVLVKIMFRFASTIPMSISVVILTTLVEGAITGISCRIAYFFFWIVFVFRGFA